MKLLSTSAQAKYLLRSQRPEDEKVREEKGKKTDEPKKRGFVSSELL